MCNLGKWSHPVAEMGDKNWIHLQFLRSKSLSELSNDLIPLLNWERKIEFISQFLTTRKRKMSINFWYLNFPSLFIPMQRLTHYCCHSNTSLDWTIARMWQCIWLVKIGGGFFFSYETLVKHSLPTKAVFKLLYTQINIAFSFPNW